jgi:FlaA1/EpsC-like NDP-sugar epimerase
VLAAAAFALAFNLRFLDAGGVPERYWTMLTGTIVFVALGKAFVFSLLGLNQKWWRYFQLPDLWPIIRAAAVTSGLLVAAFTLAKPYPYNLPRSVVVLDFLLTIVLVGGARLVRRMIAERPDRAARRRRARGVLVIGAGSGGQMVVREMRLNPRLGARAIGFLDDDPRKRGMQAVGVKVLGSTNEIGEILDRKGPDEVIIAIPSAPGVLRAKVVAACRERDITVRTLPTVFELLRGGVQLTRQLREVRVEDVLGRDPVVMELERVGAYLEDKIVMVTGAGGSVGAEICRQIARVGPKLLVLLDHAEDNLFRIDREMLDEWHFTRVEAVLADCKEADRMLEVMQRFKPDVVFHAAAYKHVPLMEANPLESVRNNVLGTRVVADVAIEFGAERFVLISTDKALNPHSVYGQTKTLCEWIVGSHGEQDAVATRFVAVRFGNVLNSNGSVIPLFRRQIERGGPVTVTDAEMTRFFMTIPEAVALVIQAGAIGGRGRIMVLDMGEPIRILDLARNMIRLSGKEPGVDIPITFIGTRPGEKIHEELFAEGETWKPTTHAKIVALDVSPVDAAWLEQKLDELNALVEAGETLELVGRLAAIVREPQRLGAHAETGAATATPASETL